MATPKPCSCPICDESFPSITKMQAHRKTCDLVCPGCDRIFKFKGAYTKHVAGCKYPCMDCDMRFKTEFKLAEHRSQVHEDKTPWKCTECTKEFARQDRLKRHMDEIHKGIKRKIETALDDCCPCGYTSSRKLNWTRHINSCPAHRIGARNFLQKAFSDTAASSTQDPVDRALEALRQTCEAARQAAAKQPSS
jgi:uncharacterized C2H2 Zn-finger protein